VKNKIILKPYLTLTLNWFLTL